MQWYRCLVGRQLLLATATLCAGACGRLGFVAEGEGSLDGNVARACDPAFTLVGASGDRFLLVAEPHPWSDAAAACSAFGTGHQLAVLSDDADRLIVGEAAGSTTRSSWLLGVTDLAAEGEWRDLDGAIVTYLPWAMDEPNNSGDEDCASVLADPALGSGYNNRYNDVLCNLAWPSICQCRP